MRNIRSLTPRIILGAFCIALLTSAQVWAAGGSSAPSVPTPSASVSMTPQQHYNQGLKYRDKAWELEKKAAVKEGKTAEKLLKKAQKEYKKAARSQREAVLGDAMMYQAHSSLGYALRKLGEYGESIASYDRALSLSPGYTEAIEYRAEAYLGLNRLEEAKEAYLILMREDQARADELMTAMKKWLEEQKNGTSAVSASDLDAFATWVEDRADIAGHAAMLASTSARGW